RVRFAPAPTGFLHVGSARAALFNWLFARHVGGTFVLRIEDTDPERSRDDLVEGIERSLKWLGLDWDEGPYRQSERMHLYREAADRLLAGGLAYYCACDKAEIEARNPAGGYDGFCRDRGFGPGPGRALRFRTPGSGETVVHDVIRGDVVFDNAHLEDFVILRTGGEPMFILAYAVDDADMRISHVLRGEDLLSSTPKVLLLRHALGYSPDDDPLYGHLPVIVNEKRQKLSKRRDDVALEEFRERGYLPQAMRNYLALLGWGPPSGKEIMPVAEMVAEFRLEDVNPSPAFFDVQKLDHVNAEYIRALPPITFVRDSLPWLEVDAPWPPENFDLAVFEAVAPFVQERVRRLSEVPALVDFLFLDQPEIDPVAWEKGVVKVHDAAGVLSDAAAAYRGLADWSAPALHEATLAVGEAHGLKLGKAQAPIRVAVTGRTVGPPLFESLTALGRDRAIERVQAALARLQGS
ncbi:MAG TPA: glutamate--tRNA ligase, partial [Acidimicrobiales bacterium]|nr:glutamate--tRNA ligase [Acidimicrobiales bacterium]